MGCTIPKNVGDSLEEWQQAAAEAGRVSRPLWGDAALAFADEELSALLRFDWTPANIQASPPAGGAGSGLYRAWRNRLSLNVMRRLEALRDEVERGKRTLRPAEVGELAYA